MTKILNILPALFLSISLFSQPKSFILKSSWDDNSLPIASPGNLNLQYNSVWGMAINGHEIAVLGNAGFVLFFDVTDPTNPVLLEKFAGANVTIWREFKSYKNRVYAVSDGSSEGLMIFDLSNAPTTIKRTYYSNEFFGSSHSIMLDTVSGHIYLNGNNVANLLVLDVSQNPDQPKIHGKASLPGGYIHDSYVRGDTLYASHGYGGYYIYDCKTDPNAPKFLASMNTGGYNHNSWLTTDGRYSYYSEEIPAGRPIQIVDLQNLADGEITSAGSFLDAQLADPAGPLAIPHNVYIRDSFLFVSQYEDGLLVYNISEPTDPVLLNVYDTHPENTKYNGYFGCWGNYPWLPSGNILASDMQNGLFVLQMPDASIPSVEPIEKSEISLWPNPTADFLTVKFQGENWKYQVSTAAGQIVFAGKNASRSVEKLDVRNLAAGIYFIEIQSVAGERLVSKFVKK